MFYRNIDRDLAVAQLPKAGLDTFNEWLGKDFMVVKNEDALVVSVRVAFFRHPMERLRSGYSMFYWMDDYGHPHDCGAPVDSWESFVDYILEHDNEHWRPQSIHVGDVPNIYHRFENLTSHWEKYRPGILPHNNWSTRLPTTDYRSNDLNIMFTDDLDIWEDAT